MGMYSYVEDCSLEIVDEKGLNAWTLADAKRSMAKVHDKTYRVVELKEMLVEYDYWLKQIKDYGIEDGELFNDKKIVGYWYSGFCYFIRDMAQFIEGELYLQYEEPLHYAKITFKDGQCFCETIELELKFENGEEIETFAGLKQLSKKEKMMREL